MRTGGVQSGLADVEGLVEVAAGLGHSRSVLATADGGDPLAGFTDMIGREEAAFLLTEGPTQILEGRIDAG